MNAIQFILIGLLFASFLVYFTRLRSRLLDRIIVTVIIIGGIVLVIWPELSQLLASRLGVGRGADMVLYLGLVGLIFVSILQFSKIRELEDRITRLARKIALDKSQMSEPLSSENIHMKAEDNQDQQ